MTTAHSSKNFALNAIPRNEARLWRPRRSHGNAEQDREHQRFEIGLTDEVDLYRLYQDGNASDRDAE